MNIKAIITTAVLSTVLAGSSAFAGDNDYLATAVDTSTAQPFVIQHAFLVTAPVKKAPNEEVPFFDTVSR